MLCTFIDDNINLISMLKVFDKQILNLRDYYILEYFVLYYSPIVSYSFISIYFIQFWSILFNFRNFFSSPFAAICLSWLSLIAVVTYSYHFHGLFVECYTTFSWIISIFFLNFGYFFFFTVQFY